MLAILENFIVLKILGVLKESYFDHFVHSSEGRSWSDAKPRSSFVERVVDHSVSLRHPLVYCKVLRWKVIYFV